jgi:glycosyltransferase involved in cell wall biosynthesis
MDAKPMCPISIVLVTYNRSAALAETLDTLRAQSFRDFELIVCDDCSPDNTEEVVRRYERMDSRIVYRRNATNLRMPGNMNEGIRQSRGEYVANLHDGDLYEPQLLEKWKSALDRNPGAAFVFNEYAGLDRDGTVAHIFKEDLPDVFPGALLLEGYFFRKWRFGSPIWGTVMARRKAYMEAGLFDSRFSFYADVDMWMRLAERYEVAYVKEPLIRIVDHALLPRQFELPHEDRLLQQMFWEARMRHYRSRPLRRLVEAGRHAGFVAANQAWLLMLRGNRLIRRGRRRRV